VFQGCQRFCAPGGSKDARHSNRRRSGWPRTGACSGAEASAVTISVRRAPEWAVRGPDPDVQPRSAGLKACTTCGLEGCTTCGLGRIALQAYCSQMRIPFAALTFARASSTSATSTTPASPRYTSENRGRAADEASCECSPSSEITRRPQRRPHVRARRLPATRPQRQLRRRHHLRLDARDVAADVDERRLRSADQMMSREAERGDAISAERPGGHLRSDPRRCGARVPPAPWHPARSAPR